MVIDVVIPQIGFSMTEGILSEWLVEDGEKVKEGQPIFSLESDKSINEIEALGSGIIRILTLPSNNPLQVGTKVGEIL